MITIRNSILDKIQQIQEPIGENSDLMKRLFRVSSNQMGALLFLEGLTNRESIEQVILPWIFKETHETHTEKTIVGSCPISELQHITTSDQAVRGLLSGNTVLIVEKVPGYFLLGIEKWEHRTPHIPLIESSIKGPQEAFVESMAVNVSLIRRFIKSPQLSVENMTIGKLSETKVTIMYIDGIVQEEIVQIVRERIQKIELDVILSASNIEHWIEDDQWSPFPLVRTSERPDVTVSSLMEGKVAILTENSPLSLSVPFTFFDSLQNMDDYYEKWHIGSLFRMVRLFALLISVLLPGLYIALSHYNPGLIPTELLMSMIAAVTNVPLLLFFELILMEIAIEIFREAGLRLPKPVGQTIGIVGGIVIGEAAVTANLISPATLLVVALTAMASYSAPVYSLAHSFRLMRFGLILSAGLLGLYGYLLGLLMMIGHLVSLQSFGVPYLTPMAPARIKDWVDLVIIFPIRKRLHRPSRYRFSSRKS